MDIFLWVIFAVLWLPAGAVAYRCNRFLNSFVYSDEEGWKSTHYTQDKFWRNLAVVLGYLAYILTVLAIILLIVYVIFIYGEKFLLSLAGK